MQRPWIGAIAAGVAAGDGPLSGDGVGRITSRRLWSALGSANAAALGTLWLMTAKPGPLESVLVVTIAVLIGAVAGWRLGGPEGTVVNGRVAASEMAGRLAGGA